MKNQIRADEACMKVGCFLWKVIMKKPKVIDIGEILDKLNAGGIVTKHPKGYKGIFSIKRHSHLLTEKELALWLHVLHKGMLHSDEDCTDEHEWSFDIIEEH